MTSFQRLRVTAVTVAQRQFRVVERRALVAHTVVGEGGEEVEQVAAQAGVELQVGLGENQAELLARLVEVAAARVELDDLSGVAMPPLCMNGPVSSTLRRLGI